MHRLLVALLLATASAGPSPAADLPDLEGREVVVASENAYPPLQYIDRNGKAVGWEYDAVAEIPGS